MDFMLKAPIKPYQNTSKWLWLKNMYQNGNLANETED